MEYKNIFKPETLAKLTKQSQLNLKKMLGDKSLMQTMISSQKLLDEIEAAEAPYKEQLEELAKEMVEKLYPVIQEQGIKLDARIVPMSDVGSELDEIKVNNPLKMTWDLTKYIPNFKSENIPVGAKIIMPRSKDFFVSEKHYLGSGKYSFIDTNGIKEILYSDYLEKLNKRGRPIGIEEIVVNNPNQRYKLFFYHESYMYAEPIEIVGSLETAKQKTIDKLTKDGKYNPAMLPDEFWAKIKLLDPKEPRGKEVGRVRMIDGKYQFYQLPGHLDEQISPEGRRRIINGITQGAALKGAFSFYLFKDYLDAIDPTLIDKYNEIMKNSFGIYDDDNAVAMMLSALAQGHKAAGGSSKVIINEIRINSPHISIHPSWVINNYDRIIEKKYKKILNSSDLNLIKLDIQALKIYISKPETLANANKNIIDVVKGYLKRFINEIRINKPVNYEKAYGESHSYKEYIENAKRLAQKADNFLLDKKRNKILAGFTGWNVANWTKIAGKDPNYGVYSRSSITNSAPYFDFEPINIEDPNSWDDNKVNNFISQWKSSLDEIKVNKPKSIQLRRFIEHIIDTIKSDENLMMNYEADIPTIKSKQNIKDLSKLLIDIDFYSPLEITKWYNKFKPQNINESQESGITIRARAINFPMLVHEIVKGLYELISLQGFKGDKETNQKVVDKVDTLANEPHDIRFGQQIFEALNDLFAESDYSDPRIREHFFAEIYQLEDDDFLEFIENTINGELSSQEKRWVNQVLKEISQDIKADDYDSEGIDEIKLNEIK